MWIPVPQSEENFYQKSRVNTMLTAFFDAEGIVLMTLFQQAKQ